MLLVIAVWALTRPAPAAPGGSIWLGFAGTQLYVLARLAMKLQFIASQTALFQGVARARRLYGGARAAWPESPAAEPIVASGV